MSSKEFARKLDQDLKRISDPNFLFIPIAETHARQVKRIFDERKNADGLPHGKYNTATPIYVDPDRSPRKFPPKGKYGDQRFKSGKPHQTGYFDSYKAFRDTIGRQTSSVDFFLNGNLRFDFTNSLTLEGKLWKSGVKRQENAGKVDGLMEKYGERSFQLSDIEKKIYVESVKLKLLDSLND